MQGQCGRVLYNCFVRIFGLRCCVTAVFKRFDTSLNDDIELVKVPAKDLLNSVGMVEELERNILQAKLPPGEDPFEMEWRPALAQGTLLLVRNHLCSTTNFPVGGTFEPVPCVISLAYK